MEWNYRTNHAVLASPERRYGAGAMKIQSWPWRGIAGYGRALDYYPEKRSGTSTSLQIVWRELGLEKISKQRSWVDASYEPSIVTALRHDTWMQIQKDSYKGEGKQGRHPPAFLRHMGSWLHAETGCRKVCAWKVFEWHTNSMEPEAK